MNAQALLTQQMKDEFIQDRFNELQAQIFLLQRAITEEENCLIYHGLGGLEALSENLYKAISLKTIEQTGAKMTKTTTESQIYYRLVGYEHNGKTWNLGTRLTHGQAIQKADEATLNPIFKAVSIQLERVNNER